MASAVSALLGGSTDNSTVAGAQKSAASGEQMFLQLLVSQMQNQDPLNPVDSTQFVSQLAQFSQLEQLIGIRSDLENGQSTAPPASSNTTDPTGNSQTTPQA